MKHLQHHYPLYLISLLPLIFFASLLGSDQLLYHGDFARFYYGNQKFCIDSYLQGRLPLWNPYQYCGIPFLANVTLGCFKRSICSFCSCPLSRPVKFRRCCCCRLAGWPHTRCSDYGDCKKARHYWARFAGCLAAYLSRQFPNPLMSFPMCGYRRFLPPGIALLLIFLGVG